MAEKGKVAWGAENLTEGGGLIDDADVLFKNCKFEITDYNGASDEEVTVFSADLIDQETEEEITQMWSVGHKDLKPSEDGEEEADEGQYLINVGKAKGVNSSSNFGMLISSASLQGFPQDKWTGEAGDLEGLIAHVDRVEVESNMKDRKTGKKEKKNREVPVITAILKMPWDEEETDKKGGKEKGKAAEKSKETKAKPVGGGDIDDAAAETVMTLLAEKGGSMTKAALIGAAFKTLKGNKDRAKISNLIGKDAWLSDDKPWGYADGKLTIPD
jgi:hypothetical protein